jgi:hypothetical protein
MKDPKYKHIARPQRFQLAFGKQFNYVKGTWNENLTYWTSASPGLVERGIRAGKTADGLWSTFRKQVRESQGTF